MLSFHASRFLLMRQMLLVSLACFTLTRVLLIIWNHQITSAWPDQLPQVVFTGLIYDLAFYSYAAILPALYLALLPERLWHGRLNRGWLHLVVFTSLYGLGFIAVAEMLFWDEFSARFNFISVDYLVYRREVTDNIAQSYPLPWLLGGIFLWALAAWAWLRPAIERALDSQQPIGSRLGMTALVLILAGAAFVWVDQDLRQFSDNRYSRELAANGPYQFFNAFKDNELDYGQFYRRIDPADASARLKRLVRENNSRFLDPGLFAIGRHIDNPGPPRRLNVMLVMIESLSAKYLGAFGSRKGLTPNLDRLAQESLFFTRFYATGTRTTRGLEAVTLSIPPTPGRSIVKRIGRESGFWSLGNILKEQGYDVRFLYGGRGYFDNMSAFFSGNGYQVIDQSSVPDASISFSNAWGMSDEDLYAQALAAADQAANGGQPFFFHLMTTSNHRPYTYPDGRIDIPSGTGRKGAVKYSDWAIGNFLHQARRKPWFGDTLFVFVADHCAGSAGKVDLPLKKYHIPLLIYAPRQIAPTRIDSLASQIDLAPTLLALLNLDYDSWAFGRNILTTPADQQRALIGNYQKLGLYQPGQLAILEPKRQLRLQLEPESANPRILALDEPDDFMRDAIAWYQGASFIYQNRLNRYPPE